MEQKVGFIGLGQMGRWMALNLLKAGFDLTVLDISLEAVSFLLDRGAKPANSPSELGRQVDLVILSLPDADNVEKVVLGKDGLVESSRAKQIVVDCGTTDYLRTLNLADLLRKYHIRLVDAPVTGMDLKAEEGTLTIMCGGDEEAFREAQPALLAMAKNIVYMGPIGNGQLAKLVNQLLYDINIAALAEILPMGVKLGLDPQKIAEVVNSGSGRSFASEFFIPGILNNQFNRGYTLNKAYKDIVSVTNISARNKIPLPMVQAATTIYQMALASGFGDEDKGAMIKVFEKMIGVEFRKTGTN